MATTTERPRRYAVLIDADNAQASTLEGILAEVAKTGEAAVKRIYGDFTSPHSNSWKPHLNAHAIRPVQQFAFTSGKNATDSALIIDAMDLMYTRRFDGFVLVSSDSDFTSLASRLREEGLEVVGFGKETTPQAFRNACNRFVLTEVLRPAPAAPKATQKAVAKKTTRPATPRPKTAAVPDLPYAFLARGIEETADDTGWAHLGALGAYLNKVQPDFDTRRHGHKQLSQLLRSAPHAFELREQGGATPGSKVLFVRAVSAD